MGAVGLICGPLRRSIAHCVNIARELRVCAFLENINPSLSGAIVCG